MSASSSTNVIASTHGNGVILLHAATGRLFASNETGARIWQKLTLRFTLDDIADDISRHYHIEIATARRHTAQFVAELKRHSLIAPRVF